LFFFRTDSRKSIIRRIAEDDEDGGVAFDVFGGVAFFFEFGEEEMFFGSLGRFPAGKSIGEEDADPFVAPFGQRGAEILEEQAKLKMGDDEGSGENFEAEDAILCSLFEVASEEGVFTSLLESFVDFFEDFDEVGAGAATGVEDVDVFIGQAVRKIQFFAEDGVNAGDHVLDNFRRSVPDAEILAEFRVEGLEERLVKVLDSVGFLEFCEKAGAVDAVEDARGPIENFGKIQVFELTGVSDFVKELAQDWDTKKARGKSPVKALFRGRRILFGP